MPFPNEIIKFHFNLNKNCEFTALNKQNHNRRKRKKNTVIEKSNGKSIENKSPK